MSPQFVNQGPNENRTIEESLDLGWKLLTFLPREELDRVDDEILDKYYEKAKATTVSAESPADNAVESDPQA